jgi:hypothetical protein
MCTISNPIYSHCTWFTSFIHLWIPYSMRIIHSRDPNSLLSSYTGLLLTLDRQFKITRTSYQHLLSIMVWWQDFNFCVLRHVCCSDFTGSSYDTWNAMDSICNLARAVWKPSLHHTVPFSYSFQQRCCCLNIWQSHCFSNFSSEWRHCGDYCRCFYAPHVKLMKLTLPNCITG